RDDLDQAVFHRDLDAETAELAARLHLHVAERLRLHVTRMRIEAGEHAVDRGFDQLGVVGLFNVVGANALEHIAEQIELPVGVSRGWFGNGGELGQRVLHQPRLRGGERERRAGSCTEEDQECLAHYPRTFSPSLAAHQGPGSTGVPSLRNSTYRTG